MNKNISYIHQILQICFLLLLQTCKMRKKMQELLVRRTHRPYLLIRFLPPKEILLEKSLEISNSLERVF